MSTPNKTGLGALLTPDDSVLLLADHQAFQFANVHSHEPTLIVNNVVGLAKSARAFGVPAILTTVLAERGGALIPELQEVFPDQKPIDRTFINAWEDQRVVDAVKATGRTKLIMAGLWTEICVAMPAIQAIGEGYEVYVVADACGGVTPEAHEIGMQRMIQAGAVPLTWMVVPSEWQRDYPREQTLPGMFEVTARHGGGTGIAFGWEMQLLHAHAGAAT